MKLYEILTEVTRREFFKTLGKAAIGIALTPLLAHIPKSKAAPVWDLVAEDDVIAIYVDKASIETQDEVTTVWRLGKYKQIQKDQFGAFDAVLANISFYCSRQAQRTNTAVSYLQGQAVDQDMTQQKWVGIAPGSVADKICDYLAGNLKPSAHKSLKDIEDMGYRTSVSDQQKEQEYVAKHPNAMNDPKYFDQLRSRMTKNPYDFTEMGIKTRTELEQWKAKYKASYDAWNKGSQRAMNDMFHQASRQQMQRK